MRPFLKTILSFAALFHVAPATVTAPTKVFVPVVVKARVPPFKLVAPFTRRVLLELRVPPERVRFVRVMVLVL